MSPNDPMSPTWRDLVGAMEGLRAEMREGFTAIDRRLSRVEQQQAGVREAASSNRWLIGFLISIASIAIAVAALIRA